MHILPNFVQGRKFFKLGILTNYNIARNAGQRYARDYFVMRMWTIHVAISDMRNYYYSAILVY